ncbi:MAG: T9SS type A sorting domain-containing protein [Oceanihabitans sp.]
MERKLLLIAMLFFVTLTVSAQCTGAFTVFTEDFEDNGNTVNSGAGRYTSTNDFKDNTTGDYWGRIHGASREYYLTNTSSTQTISTGTNYTGYNGNFFYAGEDLDDTGATLGNPDGDDIKEISFTGINITGATNMCFSGLFARGDNNGCGSSRYDSTDYIRVYYSIDGATEVLGMQFAPDLECNIPGDVSNEPLHHDPNMDGDGGEGAVLTSVLSEFTFNIAGTGSLLNLRVEVHMDSGSEEIAIDFLNVKSDSMTLGVEETNLESAISIYPNPSNGVLNINKPSGVNLEKATVYNVLGKSVKTINLVNMTDSKSLDLTALSSGLYLVNIQAENGKTITKKIVIE